MRCCFQQNTHRHTQTNLKVLEHALDKTVRICPAKCYTTDSVEDRQSSSSAEVLQGNTAYCRKRKNKKKYKKKNKGRKSCRVQSQNLNCTWKCKLPQILKRCKNCNRLHCCVRVCKCRQSSHSMVKEEASSIISSDGVFFKAIMDRTAAENG